ncbi:hypothetical protein STSR3_03 [Salmonella virus STSR3]|nr:hypothetical protein STSR3_03 [Salmonella virus STSR3]
MAIVCSIKTTSQYPIRHWIIAREQLRRVNCVSEKITRLILAARLLQALYGEIKMELCFRRESLRAFVIGRKGIGIEAGRVAAIAIVCSIKTTSQYPIRHWIIAREQLRRVNCVSEKITRLILAARLLQALYGEIKMELCFRREYLRAFVIGRKGIGIEAGRVAAIAIVCSIKTTSQYPIRHWIIAREQLRRVNCVSEKITRLILAARLLQALSGEINNVTGKDKT